MLCGAVFAQSTDRAPRADRVVVLKKERTLQLLSQGSVIKTYKVALGGDPVGPKERQGDHKTPEGLYILDSRNPHSQFYKSIHISYPGVRERAAAREKGRLAGRKCIRPWPAERLQMGRSGASSQRLDGRLHRCDE